MTMERTVSGARKGMMPDVASWPGRSSRFLLARLRVGEFWQVQGMVGMVTASHYVLEAGVHSEPYAELHWIPVILYVFPIMYGSLRFRLEGGLLTGLWCGVLTLPNILLWHSQGLEWLVEAMQLSVAVVVGAVLSRLVEHEAAEKRKAREIAERLALLHKQVTHAQEDERRRVARELHDDTAQSLVLLCRRLDEAASAPRPPRRMLASLEELRAIAEETLAGVRRYMQDLRPSMLDDLGLVAAVEWLTADLTTRRGIDVRVGVSGEQRRLPSEAELSLFRIVQEALRNVEKHAEASRVSVDVAFENRSVFVSVRDNGKGFIVPPSLNELVASGKLGLVGMQERAQLSGGSLLIDSDPWRGTSVRARLDVPYT